MNKQKKKKLRKLDHKNHGPFQIEKVVSPLAVCDTGTSGQCRSDGNIELVRFLDSHEGDGARAVFAGVQLIYKNNFPNDPPSKFAHR